MEPTGRRGTVNAPERATAPNWGIQHPVIEPIDPLRSTPRPPARPALVRWASLFYGGLAALSLGWAALAGTPWAFASEAARRVGVRWASDIGLGLAAAAAVIGLSHVVTTRTRWGETLGRELARAIGPLSGSQSAWLAALSGFAEEAFFRGALQPRIGWAAATLLFGLAHFVPRRELLPWTGFAIAVGALLGALFEATGNLVAPVVAHAVVNGINLRLLTQRYCDG